MDYEDKNTYFDYDMTYRYCNILTVVFICLIYSSGIPILYPIVCFYFMLVYVCDKYMLFRWYKKPAVLDGHIALNSLEWFKFALFMHVIFGSVMYSSSEILNTKESAEFIKNNLREAIYGKDLSQFLQIHIVIFISSFLAIIVLWILWKVLFKHMWKKICKNKDETKLSVSEHFIKSQEHCDNIYEKMAFGQLVIEHTNAKYDIELLDAIDTKNNTAIYKDYLACLKTKIRGIEARFRQIAHEN